MSLHRPTNDPDGDIKQAMDSQPVDCNEGSDNITTRETILGIR